MKVNVKHSMRTKLTLVLLCLMAGNFFVYILLNHFLLETFYLDTKEKSLLKGYEKINEILEDKDVMSQKDANAVAEVCEKYGITIIIIDTSDYIEFQYGNGKILQERLREINFNFNSENQQIIKKANNYVLQKYTPASQEQGEYMELTGFFNSDLIFLMRIAVESIHESVSISLKFFLYAGVFVMVCGLVIAFFVSGRFTRPILELSKLSKEMSKLNFKVKSNIKTGDELGVLGQSMNELSDKLEETIVELKRANYELQKDIAKKEEVDSMRKEFISNVSHELKTPIALIQGYAEGLKECVNDDDESREFYCEVIMDEADRMNKMVKNLLSLNQLESGNFSVQYEKFDISEVISGVIQKLNYMLKQKEIEIEYDKISSFVYADEFMIEEVVTNYLTNAINHTDEHRIIKIGIENRGKMVRVSVYNSGKRIPDDSLDLIWDKFYKVDKARTREYGGSGIGLSIVKAIINTHNTKYGVDNKENGVEFWFELESELC